MSKADHKPIPDKTAGFIVIGDEILTGKVQDTNSHTLSQVLFDRGVSLKQIIVVPDKIETISHNTKLYSKEYEYVLTSGGIGPTHDDVTYAAIAHAFQRELEYHEPTLEMMRKKGVLSEDLDPDQAKSRMKMALLPKGADVLSTPRFWVPLVRIENIFVLPGVPELFSRMLNAFSHHFSGPRAARRILYTKKSESEIATFLSQIQSENEHVSIGSYPQYKNTEYKVLISIESKQILDLDPIVNKIKTHTEAFALPEE
jgi:molybdenum cofactor synthesis domain-containing protein